MSEIRELMETLKQINEDDSKAEGLAYYIEKNKYQETYGWNDEQFETFWNNPEKNSYVEGKRGAIRDAKLAIEFINRGRQTYPDSM